MKKSRSTWSHFTHARRCSRALNRVPIRAKRPASIRTYSLWKGDIFPIDHFTGYKKSNQNQTGRVLPFAFTLKCNKFYLLFSSLSDFDSFRWRVHLSYGVCGLRVRVQLKTLSSLLKYIEYLYNNQINARALIGQSAIEEFVNHTPKEFVNHSPAARDLQILLVFYQHPAWFISL